MIFARLSPDYSLPEAQLKSIALAIPFAGDWVIYGAWGGHAKGKEKPIVW
jgi:hypothetical protein